MEAYGRPDISVCGLEHLTVSRVWLLAVTLPGVSTWSLWLFLVTRGDHLEL